MLAVGTALAASSPCAYRIHLAASSTIDDECPVGRSSNVVVLLRRYAASGGHLAIACADLRRKRRRMGGARLGNDSGNAHRVIPKHSLRNRLNDSRPRMRLNVNP